VFTHKLALALKFMDATDGRGIEHDIRISVNDRPAIPSPRQGGYFVFMSNELPEDAFDMDVRASGYVPTKRRILLEAPGIGPPLSHIELIPEAGSARGALFASLSGTKKGLSAIDAVKLGKNPCLAESFDARRRTLRVYNPYRFEFNRARYALVDPSVPRYEAFAIEKRVSNEAFIIDHPLTSDVSAEFPIMPIVSGDVNAEGEYLLRVRDDTAENRWIVRFTEDSGERFELVDFNEAAVSAKGKARVKDVDG
jgi:hypothetical protein